MKGSIIMDDEREEYNSCRPCTYDRFSPCEWCGKCYSKYNDEDYEPDPDRDYELARDEGRLLTI